MLNPLYQYQSLFLLNISFLLSDRLEQEIHHPGVNRFAYFLELALEYLFLPPYLNYYGPNFTLRIGWFGPSRALNKR